MTTVMTLDGPKELNKPVLIDCELYNRLYRFLAPLAGGDWRQAADPTISLRSLEGEAAAILNDLEHAALPPGSGLRDDAVAAGWLPDQW